MHGGGPCNKLRHLIGEYNCETYKQGLKRSRRQRMKGKSLVSGWESIRVIASACDVSRPTLQKIKCNKRCSYCPAAKVKDDILDIAEKSKRDCKGLCLECVRADTILEIGESCAHKFKT
jgi:hypothetical protein